MFPGTGLRTVLLHSSYIPPHRPLFVIGTSFLHQHPLCSVAGVERRDWFHAGVTR